MSLPVIGGNKFTADKGEKRSWIVCEGDVFGSGIKRIRDAMKEYGLRPPVIRTAETWFSITFRRKGPDEAIESLSRKGIGEPARPGSPKGSSKGSPITRERIITLMAACEPSNHQRSHRLKFADYKKGCPQADSQTQGRGFAPPHRFATRRLLGG